MDVHTGREEGRQGSSETWHCYNVITGVSMRPGNIKIGNVHSGGYTDWVITLIDLMGSKINIILVQSVSPSKSTIWWWLDRL